MVQKEKKHMIEYPDPPVTEGIEYFASAARTSRV